MRGQIAASSGKKARSQVYFTSLGTLLSDHFSFLRVSRQGSGHGVRQAGCLDRLTWLFVSMGVLLLALDGP
jgi:hypothetical protein